MPELTADRLEDLDSRVALGDRRRVAAWFRLRGTRVDPSYVTPRARRGESPLHGEHLVPVRVLVDRLLAGSIYPEQVPQALCLVEALAEENKNAILKMQAKGGPSDVYKALLACPPARLVEVASWRYLAVGIPLVGLGGRPRIALRDADRVGSLVARFAAKYDRTGAR